ncbi:MAG: UvrD-helicase domain-containing protein, partial [Prevotellaceae bacterium]|nr:UvrD-helicase domain-containing protein [Prevotellaceae bacterium]
MELLLYKASAGSGKTFTIVVEYLKHLMAHPLAYRRILAVTFTNKATAEMKERVLAQLQGIWQGDPDSDAYLQKLLLETGKGEEELRAMAGKALRYILHDYSRFRIETIDSFFQSVLRNLARELGLSLNFEIEMDTGQVLGDAVDGMIEKLTPTSEILSWLLEYIYEKIDDDKRWNVSREVKSFAQNIFDETYIERGGHLRETLKATGTLERYRKQLKALMKESQEEMPRFADRFDEELARHDLTITDLKSGARGICGYFLKLRAGKLSADDLCNKTFQDCMESAENWVSKAHKRRQEITRVAETCLLPLLKETEARRERAAYTVNSCTLTLKHLNKLQLLNFIDEEMREQNHARNRFLLTDTNTLLHRMIREGDTSFVFEKIGAELHNLMIDEFQDTSRMQWDNFRLLLVEGLSQGADSLIVGDVKQSIYRWRSGDWRILESLDKQLPFPVRIETLKTNRRSAPCIVRFNNRFFTGAVNCLSDRHEEELGERCLPLEHAYTDVVQEFMPSKEKGCVKATLLYPDDENSYEEVTLQALGDEVEQLLNEGMDMNQMAVLVRKNRHIPLIADYFQQRFGISLVSDEAFQLGASAAVSLLMDALRYLSNPEDKISKASVKNACIHEWNQTLEDTSEKTPTDTYTPDMTAFDTFLLRAEELRLTPLYELLEELVLLFGLADMPGEEAYLFYFFDKVTEYLQGNPPDLECFIRYWEEELCVKTIPGAAGDGIRICSIHKAKGLEYHTVLLPFCDWSLEVERHEQLVWCTPEEAPYNTLDLVPVNYSKPMAESVYRQDYLKERLQLWVDNLNLLYVAFTRAGSNLIVWGGGKKRNSVSELLESVLPRMAGEGIGSWDDEEQQFVYGTPCLHVAAVSGKGSPLPAPAVNRLMRQPLELQVR